MKSLQIELKQISCLILVSMIFVGCSCSSHPKSGSERPKGFPEIIVAPPNAYEVSYEIHENKTGTGADAVMTCFVKEQYPANGVVAFLENYFREKGWIQLKHDPLNLHGTLPRPLNKWEYVTAVGSEKFNRHRFEQYWVDPKSNDSIDLGFLYEFPVGSSENKSKLTIEIGYYGKNALFQRKAIEHYRTVYPDEFRVADANQ